MAILRTGAFGTFENEQEIERLISENPELLVADGATPPVLVARHLILPDCTLDCFLLDVTSIPIVVESTLAKFDNGRRGVVAQAIDSISALAALTVVQLDEAAGGAVERALWTFAGDDSGDFGRRRTSLAENLRAARVKFIVALDDLNPSMDRQIRFLAEHSHLDVQCVAIAKSRPSPPPAMRLLGLAASSHKTVAPDRHASAAHEFMRRGTRPIDHLERVQWDG